MSWQHDGSALVYWDRRQMIHHTHADATERVLFTADDVDDMELAPDGRTVYVSQPMQHTRRFAITNLAAR